MLIFFAEIRSYELLHCKSISHFFHQKKKKKWRCFVNNTFETLKRLSRTPYFFVCDPSLKGHNKDAKERSLLMFFMEK